MLSLKKFYTRTLNKLCRSNFSVIAQRIRNVVVLARCPDDRLFLLDIIFQRAISDEKYLDIYVDLYNLTYEVPHFCIKYSDDNGDFDYYLRTRCQQYFNDYFVKTDISKEKDYRIKEVNSYPKLVENAFFKKDLQEYKFTFLKLICKLFVSGYTSCISSCSKSKLSREKQSKNRSNGIGLMHHVITKLLSEVNDCKIKGLEIVIRLAGKTFNEACCMAMSSDQPTTLK